MQPKAKGKRGGLFERQHKQTALSSDIAIFAVFTAASQPANRENLTAASPPADLSAKRAKPIAGLTLSVTAYAAHHGKANLADRQFQVGISTLVRTLAPPRQAKGLS